MQVTILRLRVENIIFPTLFVLARNSFARFVVLTEV
jgi:hypothetical protein